MRRIIEKFDSAGDTLLSLVNHKDKESFLNVNLF